MGTVGHQVGYPAECLLDVFCFQMPVQAFIRGPLFFESKNGRILVTLQKLVSDAGSFAMGWFDEP